MKKTERPSIIIGQNPGDKNALGTLERFVGRHGSRQALAFAALTKLSHLHWFLDGTTKLKLSKSVFEQMSGYADALLRSVDVVLAHGA